MASVELADAAAEPATAEVTVTEINVRYAIHARHRAKAHANHDLFRR